LRSLLPTARVPNSLRNNNAGTANSRSTSHFDARRPESEARTQKTKASQTLSSHGTPLSNNPPPKTAHNHSTFRSALACYPKSLLQAQITLTASSLRPHRQHLASALGITRLLSAMVLGSCHAFGLQALSRLACIEKSLPALKSPNRVGQLADFRL
jgi:hypothetical protein